MVGAYPKTRIIVTSVYQTKGIGLDRFFNGAFRGESNTLARESINRNPTMCIEPHVCPYRIKRSTSRLLPAVLAISTTPSKTLAPLGLGCSWS